MALDRARGPGSRDRTEMCSPPAVSISATASPWASSPGASATTRPLAPSGPGAAPPPPARRAPAPRRRALGGGLAVGLVARRFGDDEAVRVVGAGGAHAPDDVAPALRPL